MGNRGTVHNTVVSHLNPALLSCSLIPFPSPSGGHTLDPKPEPQRPCSQHPFSPSSPTGSSAINTPVLSHNIFLNSYLHAITKIASFSPESKTKDLDSTDLKNKGLTAIRSLKKSRQNSLFLPNIDPFTQNRRFATTEESVQFFPRNHCRNPKASYPANDLRWSRGRHEPSKLSFFCWRLRLQSIGKAAASSSGEELSRSRKKNCAPGKGFVPRRLYPHD